jgi:hypothetical protein
MRELAQSFYFQGFLEQAKVIANTNVAIFQVTLPMIINWTGTISQFWRL